MSKRPCQFGPRCWLAAVVLVLSMPVAAAEVQENRESTRLPSFQELEAAGAVIGEIRINNRNIFDLDDPRENNAFFRLANALHIRTRPGVIRRSLLFKPGEPLSARLIEETERLLRGNAYIYDVRIVPVAYHDGVVDIEVTTRDTWTLHPGLSFGRQGGVNTGGVGLKESNLMGTGIAVGLGKTVETERSGTEFSIAQNHAFDGWTTIEYLHGKFTDGNSSAFRLDRPFYALETRWAAGLSVATASRIDSVYSGDTRIGQYRHASDRRDIYGGWSAGLSNGWTHRYSVGLLYQNDTYSAEPSLPAPPEIPADLKLVAPFLRYEVVQDDFVKVKDRNKIERVEYFELGFRSLLQLGRATTGLGSTRDLWLYNAAVSDGFALSGDDNLLLSAYANGRYGSGSSEPQLFGAAGKYYNQQRGNKLFFTSLTWDALSNGTGAEQLQLGGDTGLRGYPVHYQTGAYRALLSLEQRVYTDWYPFRLFRVGGAAFFDYGRAWGGPNPNTTDPGWLSDIGIGLRIVNDRSSRGDVLHIDLAFPIHPAPGVKPYQFLVKTRKTF
jgi:outer membrane protein assembly factor BamA